MTNNLQPLYDILGEAFKSGMAYVDPANKDGPTAGDILFPLAARMEEFVEYRETQARLQGTLEERARKMR